VSPLHRVFPKEREKERGMVSEEEKVACLCMCTSVLQYEVKKEKLMSCLTSGAKKKIPSFNLEQKIWH
jgi:hypothetical protein